MADEVFRHKFSSTLESEWEMCLFSLPLFIFLPVSLPLPFPFSLFSLRHLPPSAHLQGTNIWEMQFEHFSATKKRQTMLEKRGDKHAAELMLDKHVAFPPIHKWPCHVHALTGVEIQGQTWLRPWLLLLFLGLFACRACLCTIVWQICSLKDAALKNHRRGMAALKKDGNEGISLHQLLS